MSSTEVLRKNTIKFTFDRTHTRPKPFEVKRWFIETVKINESDVVGVFMSFLSNAVYVKLKTPELCCAIVDKYDGNYKFNHSDGTVSDVPVSYAGLGIRTIRLFEVPFEMPAEEIEKALKPYGKILSNAEETWAEANMFVVLNGIRQVKIELFKHIPSFIEMCGYRVLVIYDGQPKTCALCNSTTHIKDKCSKRRVAQLPAAEPAVPGQPVSLKLTYAAAVYPQGRAGTSTTGQEKLAEQGKITEPSQGQEMRSSNANPPAAETIERPSTVALHASMTSGVNIDSEGGQSSSGLLHLAPSAPEVPATDIEEAAGHYEEIRESQEADGQSNQNDQKDSKGKKLQPRNVNEKKSPKKLPTGTPKRNPDKEKEKVPSDRSSTESAEKSPNTSHGGSPKKKKYKKRKLAPETLESMAPILQGKLRVIQERDKKTDESAEAEGPYERLSENRRHDDASTMSARSADSLPLQNTSEDRTEWSEETEDAMEDESIHEEDVFY